MTAGEAASGIPSRAELALARTIANRAAAANGDAGQVSGQVVLSTRQVAMKYTYGASPGGPDAPVMVILIHGSFNGEAFDHPPGRQTGSGDEMVLLVDPQTGKSYDVAQRNVEGGQKELNLSVLGTPAALPD